MPDYDDLDRRDDDRYDDAPGRRGDVIATAKGKVKAPAIGLIVSGVLAVLAAGYGLVQSGDMDAQIADQLKKVDDNPGLSADQKRQQKEFMTSIFDIVKVAALPMNLVNLAMAGLMILGGVKMLSLTGRGLTLTGAVVGMISCGTGCCVTGLVFGIWAVIALNNPTVKAGYAAVARGAGGGPE